MAYGSAMLGETVELYKNAIEWGKEQQELIEKKERARAFILADLEPLIEEKRRLRAIRKEKETTEEAK